MNSLFRIIILLFCFSSASAQTQTYYLTLNKYQTQYRDKKDNTNIIIYAYPFHGNLADMRDFRTKVEAYTGPDFIPMTLPQSIDTADCVVFMCFVQQLDKADQGSTILLLANHFSAATVELFVDQNLDYNFTNDQPQKIDVQRGEAAVSVEIIDEQQHRIQRSFLFELPLITLEQPAPTQQNQAEKREKKSKVSPVFGQFAVTVGTGDLRYNYISTFNGFPAEYKVSYTTKGFGAGLLFNKWNLKIGLNATFENYFFYTSYLQYQYRVEEYDTVRNDFGDLIRQYTGNTYTNSSFDAQQRNRISTAVSLQYAFKVGKKIKLQPGFEGGLVHYLTPNYVYNTAKNISYANPQNEFWQYNLTFLGKTDRRSEIYFTLSMQQINWAPKNLFNDLVKSDLHAKQTTFKTSIGINF